MMHYNKFYTDLRTIDYGLLCVALWCLEALPFVVEPSQVEEETKWKSGYKFGSKEDQEATLEYLRNVATPTGFRWSEPTPIEEKLPTVVEDWDNAVWEKYYKKEGGSGYFIAAFDNKWLVEEFGAAHIEDPLSDDVPPEKRSSVK